MLVFAKETEKIKEQLAEGTKVFVVFDKNVEYVASALDCPKMGLDASEDGKNMTSVLEICKWLMDNGADRSSLLLGIGGGIICDIAGFSASIYKRGIRYADFPTTLLSMADAAIGGKNGVNFGGFKNMLGSFKEPEFTFICPRVLESLSERDFRCGIAEVLKAAIISDDWTFYDRAVELFSEHDKDKIMASEALMADLTECIKAAAQLKLEIVKKDFLDRGERHKLNLGHTFAHAIESVAAAKGDDVKHGEAVAMGIVMATEMALKKEYCENEFADMIRLDFEDCGLKVDCPYSAEELAPAMKQDKKASAEGTDFVLPFDLGDVRIVRI